MVWMLGCVITVNKNKAAIFFLRFWPSVSCIREERWFFDSDRMTFQPFHEEEPISELPSNHLIPAITCSRTTKYTIHSQILISIEY